ncbi:hypothetical protein SSX86_023473 [Deinandra increscens subsp. villosa]|uniref:Lysosomal Pro-X carboxypeptidase n=1 Tax=Deinandra increscens subsp. villosa TaxID=3103831 RepID=A0AAP0CKX8_9ASTR
MAFLLFLLCLILVIFTVTTMGVPNIPSLDPVNRFLKGQTDVSKIVSSDFQEFFYDQTLDHFNYRPESYTTFQQRYYINYKWWGGASNNAPIFAYLGAESPIDDALWSIGFLPENAPRFNALLVYMEHRFYGQSNPVGSMEAPNMVDAMEKSLENPDTRGYFNSAQALADYAELLLYLKNQLQAHNSPIIVIGGSYGGMLASWFRLKYPHIALGALASSAPILYFENLTPPDGYYSVVTQDFKEASQNCYTTIKQSWDVIDQLATTPSGLAYLSQKFQTCSPLSNADELKNYLKSVYSNAAQYDAPPNYPTARICQGIDGASDATDILDRIFAGVVAYMPGMSCYVTSPEVVSPSESVSQTSIGWEWQTCSELLIPLGITSEDSMFQSLPYDANVFIDNCVRSFGVGPRPHWVTTYYGGQDIKLILSKFGSNIIFSNGLRDPYSIGGVLENISENIVAIKTTEGSHCLDILSSGEADPEWLVKQRKDEANIIDRWFAEYYRNFRLL